MTLYSPRWARNILQAEQNRSRELGVLPKIHGKAFLKIHKYPSADDSEGKKRLHGV